MSLSSQKGVESPERSRRGMTLIELLISLAIIGLMTGIAFPLFSYYQRRSQVDNDVRNFVQLFNYARALQNNPENISRIADQNQGYNYVIKFTNTNDIKRATLYSSANGVIDETYPIDKVDFSEDISTTYRHGGSSPRTDDGSDLVIKFNGTPPKETVTCSGSSETQTIGCNMWLRVSLVGKSITKSATIINTFDWAASNTHTLLSINADK